QRPHEAIADVALTLGVDGHVERNDERGEPGIARTAYHVLGNPAVLCHIELEPAVLRGNAAEVLDESGSAGRHDEGHIGIFVSLGQHYVSAVSEQSDEAGGSDADGARVGPTE